MGRSIAANAFTFLILMIAALGGFIAWAQGQFRNEGPLTEDLVIEVVRGATLGGISENLLYVGAISNEQIFRIGARYTQRDTKLKFGEYVLPAGSSMDEILNILVEGKSIQYFVTIPEGMYIAEIVARINANEDLTGEIENLPTEGMLAPNTYSFQRGDTRQSVVDRMFEAQIAILDAAWEGRAEGLPLASKEELLILASIVESEAGGAGEWGLVASVFYNRLAANMRPLYLFLWNKWYFDEAYDFLFVKPAKRFGHFLWKKLDGSVIDGTINGIAMGFIPFLTRAAAKAQSGYLFHYAFAMILGVVGLITWFAIFGGAR